MLKPTHDVEIVLHPYGCKAFRNVSGTVGKREYHIIPVWLAEYIKCLQMEVSLAEDFSTVVKS